MSGNSSPPALPRPIVGRERELRELSRMVDAAASGAGSIVLVSGEAGIGKTRLVQELARRLRPQRIRLAWATCWEADVTPAFWPWVQVLQACRPGHERDDLLRALQGLQRDRAPYDVDGARDLRLEPDEERPNAFARVDAFLRSDAADEPLVVVFDDLQWVDESSLVLLGFLAPYLMLSRVLVVATYRDDELNARHPLWGAFRVLIGHALSLPLDPLDSAEVAELVEPLLSQRVAPDLAELLHRQSGGNPFVAEELARLVASEPRTAPTGSSPMRDVRLLPARVRTVIERRLSPLTNACQNLLSAAALLGDEFSVSVLESATSMSSRRVADLLDEAVQASIVEATGAFTYRFRHALVREALEARLPTARRRELHRRIGEVLEVLGADDEKRYAELAHHFLRAAAEGEAAKAVTYASKAAEHALSTLAYEEAAAHLERALTALESTTTTDESRHIELLLRLGEARTKAGLVDPARAAYEAAARLASKERRVKAFARAALGFGDSRRGYSGNTDDTLVGLLEEALGLLPEADSPLRAMTLARLAIELANVASDRCGSLSDASVEMARRTGDRAALAAALEARHVASRVQHLAGAERLVVAQELLRVAEEVEDPALLLWSRVRIVIDRMELGDIMAVDGEIGAFARRAEQLRQPMFTWFPVLWTGMRALMDGRLDDAEARAREALEVGRLTRPAQALQNFRAQQFGIARAQGWLEELEEDLRASVTAHPDRLFERCYLALLLAEVGRLAPARAELQRLAADDFAAIPRTLHWKFAMACLAEAAVLLDDRDHAPTLYALLLPHASSFAYAGFGADSVGSLSRHLGSLAGLLGRWEQAAEHFEMALAAHQTAGLARYLAHTQEDYGRALLKRGAADDVDRGRRLVEAAVSAYRELGLEACARRAASDLAAVGDAATARPAVFRAEGEYWTITYAGTTVRVKDARGVGDVAYLLAHPGREVHVMDLLARGAGAQAGRLDRATTAGVAEQGLRRSGQNRADPVIDDQARESYRTRLIELGAELEDADVGGDSERVARLRAEFDWLSDHLASAYGLHGRARTAGDPLERARKSAWWRIRSAIDRLARHHPALGRHLSRSIVTGTFCAYRPERPTEWCF